MGVGVAEPKLVRGRVAPRPRFVAPGAVPAVPARADLATAAQAYPGGRQAIVGQNIARTDLTPSVASPGAPLPQNAERVLPPTQPAGFVAPDSATPALQMGPAQSVMRRIERLLPEGGGRPSGGTGGAGGAGTEEPDREGTPSRLTETRETFEHGVRYIFPVVGQDPKRATITNPFGGRQARAAGFTGNLPSLNHGTDIAAKEGTRIRAPASAKVVSMTSNASQHFGYGNSIVIQDRYGVVHRFAHLSTDPTKVFKPGQSIAQGQHLGAVGATGNATGPHLDYEAWRPGEGGRKDFFNAMSMYGGGVGVGWFPAETSESDTLSQTSTPIPPRHPREDPGVYGAAGGPAGPPSYRSPSSTTAAAPVTTSEDGGDMPADGAGADNTTTGMLRRVAASAEANLNRLNKIIETNPLMAQSGDFMAVVTAAQNSYNTAVENLSQHERATGSGSTRPTVVSAGAQEARDRYITVIKSDGTVERIDNPNYQEGYVDPAVAARQADIDLGRERLGVEREGLVQRQNEAVLQASTQRYVAELQAAAQAADLEWDKEKARITQAYNDKRLSFDEAQAAAAEAHNRVMADLERSQQALAQRRDEISIRGQDIGASESERSTEQRRRESMMAAGSSLLNQAIQSGTSAGNAALSASVGSLPFVAPTGANARMDALLSSIGGQPANLGPTPSMPLPFDPTQLGQQVASQVVSQFRPQAEALMQAGQAELPAIVRPPTPPQVTIPGAPTGGGFVAPGRRRVLVPLAAVTPTGGGFQAPGGRVTITVN